MDNKKLNQYNIDTQSVNTAAQIITECTDIMFVNYGPSVANIKGITLPVGKSLSISGNIGDVMTHPIIVGFNDTDPANNNLIVIRRMYL